MYRWWTGWGENTRPGVPAGEPTGELHDSDARHGEHYQETGGDDC